MPACTISDGLKIPSAFQQVCRESAPSHLSTRCRSTRVALRVAFCRICVWCHRGYEHGTPCDSMVNGFGPPDATCVVPQVPFSTQRAQQRSQNQICWYSYLVNTAPHTATVLLPTRAHLILCVCTSCSKLGSIAVAFLSGHWLACVLLSPVFASLFAWCCAFCRGFLFFSTTRCSLLLCDLAMFARSPRRTLSMAHDSSQRDFARHCRRQGDCHSLFHACL